MIIPKLRILLKLAWETKFPSSEDRTLFLEEDAFPVVDCSSSPRTIAQQSGCDCALVTCLFVKHYFAREQLPVISQFSIADRFFQSFRVGTEEIDEIYAEGNVRPLFLAYVNSKSKTFLELRNAEFLSKNRNVSHRSI